MSYNTHIVVSSQKHTVAQRHTHGELLISFHFFLLFLNFWIESIRVHVMSRSSMYPVGKIHEMIWLANDDSICNTIFKQSIAYNMLITFIELNSRLAGSVQHSFVSYFCFELSWKGFSIVFRFRRLSKPSYRINEKKRVCAMNACIVCVPTYTP